MKKHLILRSRFTAVSLAAMLALLPRYGVAADKPPSSLNKPSAESKSTEYDLIIMKGEFEWAGGKLEPTLGNVVDALREVYPTANIVMAPGLSTLKVSDLKLRAGNLWEYLEAIRVASGAKFDWTGPGSAGPNLPAIDPATGLRITTAPTETNTGLFVLREAVPTPETERTVEAFNIGPYLQWLQEKLFPQEAEHSREAAESIASTELQDIVATTLATLKPGSYVELPSLRFHRGANLLVVVGTRNAVDVARKVVDALPGQTDFPSFRGGGGGRGFGGVVAPGMSPETSDTIRKRYGLPSSPATPPDPTQSH